MDLNQSRKSASSDLYSSWLFGPKTDRAPNKSRNGDGLNNNSAMSTLETTQNPTLGGQVPYERKQISRGFNDQVRSTSPYQQFQSRSSAIKNMHRESEMSPLVTHKNSGNQAAKKMVK